MSNLIPEQRADKNGVVVTRHVRAANPETKTKNKIPSPVISLDEANRILPFVATHHGPTAKLVKVQLVNVRKIMTDAQFNLLMLSLNTDSLDRIDKGPAIPEMILKRTINSCLKERSFALLNNVAVLTEAISPDFRNDCGVIIAGLDGVLKRGAKRTDYSRADEDQLVAARAMIRAIEKLPIPYARTDYTAKVPMRFVAPTHLHDLIERRPESVDRIISILSERNLPVGDANDIAALEEIIDNSTAGSLLDGSL